MSKSRIKAPAVQPIASREEMEIVVGEIAKYQAKEQKLVAEMNIELERVKRHYTADLTDLTEKIDLRYKRVREWAEENPTLFDKVRSLATVHGKIGFRLGNYAVGKIKGWTWDRVVEKLMEFAVLSKAKKDEGTAGDPASFEEKIVAYLRFTPSINKEALIADRETFAKDELLRIGCVIERDEAFYVEANIETTETRLQEKEAA
jgi:phage host-nuclease inhibitor protein Gam